MNRRIAIAASLACPFSVAEAASGVYGQSERLPSHRMTVANATIEVNFAPGRLHLTRAEILDWIADGARTVADYHGRYPVDKLKLVIRRTNAG